MQGYSQGQNTAKGLKITHYAYAYNTMDRTISREGFYAGAVVSTLCGRHWGTFDKAPSRPRAYTIRRCHCGQCCKERSALWLKKSNNVKHPSAVFLRFTLYLRVMFGNLSNKLANCIYYHLYSLILQNPTKVLRIEG